MPRRVKEASLSAGRADAFPENFSDETYDEPLTRNVPKSLAKFFFRELLIRIRIFSANKNANTKRVCYADPIRAIRPNLIWFNLIHSADSFRRKRCRGFAPHLAKLGRPVMTEVVG
jgi:hypothetical protein